MSLVHDALEKAKRESSAKSARELGLAEPRAGQPFRATRRLHPAAVAAIAVFVTLLAVFVGIAMLGSRIRAKEQKEAERARVSSSATPAETTRSEPTKPAGSAAVATFSVAPAAEAAPASPTPSNPVASAPAAAASPISAPTSPAAPAPTPTAPVPTASSAPKGEAPGSAAKPADSRASRSYVRELALPDGTVVRLGGIAWSEEAPLAYLNGKLYARGESVQGLQIERIERERVVFSRGAERLYLRLR